MKKIVFIALLVLLWSVITTKAQEIPSPEIWLRADSTSFYEKMWQDISGNNRHALFAADSARLVFGEQINFNPAISFRELKDSMFIENFSVSDKMYLKTYVVFRNSEDNLEKYIWGTADALYHKLLVSNWNVYDEFNRFSYDFGKTLNPVMAGVSKYWDKTNETGAAHIFLGGYADKAFNGEIAEFMVFDEELSLEEDQVIGSYLALKYGIGMLQSTYRNSDKEVILEVAEDEIYGFGIFGIARDDKYGLNQKQAINSYGVLSVSAGDFSLSNIENPYRLDNKTFILFANNGEDPKEYESSYQDENASYLFNACKWKVTSTGANTPDVKTTLKVNRSDLFADSINEIFLIIDNNEDDSYKDVQTIAPDSIAQNGDMYFKNLRWNNYNRPDYFTFAIRSALKVEIKNYPPVCKNALGMITCSVYGGEKPYEIMLVNLDSGQEFNYICSENYIEMDSLPAGVYSIDIRDEQHNRFLYQTKEPIYNDNIPVNIEAVYYIEDQPLHLTIDSIEGYVISSCKWYAGENLLSETNEIIIDNEDNYKLELNIEQNCEYTREFYVADLRDTGGGDDDDGGNGDGDNNEDDVTGNKTINGSENTITLFPNPAENKKYNLSFKYQTPADLIINITTISGQNVEIIRLKNISTYNFHGTVNKSGIYIITIWQEGKRVFTKKLIVKE